MKPTYEQLEQQLAESQSKLEEMVAENAKLADCANFYRIGFKPVKGAFGIEYRPTEQLLDDCGNNAIEAIKTPTTDSFLAEVRSSGEGEANEREIFEKWVMENYCISKSTLEGLRTCDGYRNSTLSGRDYNGMWLQWKAIRAAQLRQGGAA
ncbi:hypothetical protein [Lelliottia amnigena]|uniref:hypothetical protein n=1 Tax=Lelliottia amnigena TaxID=61646 RepID=UPI004056C043